MKNRKTNAEHSACNALVMRPCVTCQNTAANIRQDKNGVWDLSCGACGTHASGNNLVELFDTWNDGETLRQVLSKCVADPIDLPMI